MVYSKPPFSNQNQLQFTPMTSSDLKIEFEQYLKKKRDDDADTKFDEKVEDRGTFFVIFVISKDLDWKEFEKECKGWWESKGYESLKTPEIIEHTSKVDSVGVEEFRQKYVPIATVNSKSPLTKSKRLVKNAFGPAIFWSLMLFAFISFFFAMFSIVFTLYSQNTMNSAITSVWSYFSNSTVLNQTIPSSK